MRHVCPAEALTQETPHKASTGTRHRQRATDCSQRFARCTFKLLHACETQNILKCENNTLSFLIFKLEGLGLGST